MLLHQIDRRKLKKSTHVIVVEGRTMRPMSFGGEQFCFVHSNEQENRLFPVEIYDRQTAEDLITKTHEFRSANKFSPGEYVMLPVYLPTTQDQEAEQP